MNETDIPVSLNILRRQQYLLAADESDFLDWLIIKHRGFGFKEFNYSYAQIESEIGIKRTRLEKIVSKFKEMGFLKAEVKGVKIVRALKTHFDVDYKRLLNQLSQLITQSDQEYYNSWKAFLTKCARGERKKEKRPKGWEAESRSGHEILTDIWNERIDLYNEKREDGRLSSHTRLPINSTILSKLHDSSQEIGWEGVKNSFTAFADAVIRGEKKVRSPLQCFFKNDNGYFEVINEYLDYHNLHYTYKKQ